MSSVTTTRPIGLDQLNAELGMPGLTAVTSDAETTVTADVPQATLQAAIDKHVPEEPPPTLEALVASLRERVTAAEAATDDIIIGALMGEFPPLT